MNKIYSIAEARDRFAALVHDVEQDGPVQITRRGEVVAVLFSLSEYQRLTEKRAGFIQAVSEFRAAYNVPALEIDPDLFAVRPADSGRDVDL